MADFNRVISFKSNIYKDLHYTVYGSILFPGELMSIDNIDASRLFAKLDLYRELRGAGVRPRISTVEMADQFFSQGFDDYAYGTAPHVTLLSMKGLEEAEKRALSNTYMKGVMTASMVLGSRSYV